MLWNCCISWDIFICIYSYVYVYAYLYVGVMLFQAAQHAKLLIELIRCARQWHSSCCQCRSTRRMMNVTTFQHTHTHTHSFIYTATNLLIVAQLLLAVARSMWRRFGKSFAQHLIDFIIIYMSLRSAARRRLSLSRFHYHDNVVIALDFVRYVCAMSMCVSTETCCALRGIVFAMY